MNQDLYRHLKDKAAQTGLVGEVFCQPSLIADLLAIIAADPGSAKFRASKTIRLVSEVRPDLVLPYFNDIASLLKHNNHFILWDAVLILANLAQIDHGQLFGGIFETYFTLLRAPDMITAANVAGNAWKIVLSQPAWEAEITGRLLAVARTTYYYRGEPSPECGQIINGRVLECFEHYFSSSGRQAEMIEFARQLLDSPRRAVARQAAGFLDNHGQA
jgi:hypothetical protein